MDNRQPSPGQEGRVLIIPEGNIGIPVPNFYAKVKMADNPIKAGTSWSKETVLPDTTCVLLGIATTSEPKDAFESIPRIANQAKESTFQRLMTGRFI